MKRPPVTLAVGLLLLLAAWVSAGRGPFIEAVAGAPVPIDFVRDYVSAHERLHGVANGGGNDEALALGVPRVVLLGAPYYVHPPSALLFVLPLGAVSFETAARLWFVLSLVALGALAFALVGIATRAERPRAALVIAAILLLALWPAVLHNLAKGQWSIFLAACLATGWRALERGRPRTAGAWLGLAASLKATPVLLLGYLAVRHRRAAGAMLATLAATALASVAVFGVQPWRDWLVNARPNVVAWQTWTANTASLNGLFARLFAGGPFARPFVVAPGVAQMLGLAVTVLLGVAALAATSTSRGEATAETDRRLCAAWIALAVVANPLAWTHTTILALVPAALLVGLVPPAVLVVALVALTVPRETLAALAGPVPVGPVRGLALSAHLAAVLLLFGAALRPAVRGEPERAHAHSPAPP